MNALLEVLLDLASRWTVLLDVASWSWLASAIVLMCLTEFKSDAARRTRRALTPVAIVLALAFAIKLTALFGPMLGFGSV